MCDSGVSLRVSLQGTYLVYLVPVHHVLTGSCWNAKCLCEMFSLAISQHKQLSSWLSDACKLSRLTLALIRQLGLRYLRGTVNLGAVVGEVVVHLFPADGLQLWKQRQWWRHREATRCAGCFHTHHVVPEADGHLSVSSFAEVETVQREESGVCFTLLSRTRHHQQTLASSFKHALLVHWVVVSRTRYIGSFAHSTCSEKV